MKNSHYYPHSGGILGCHAYVNLHQTNFLPNVTIFEKLRCAHKLQTISDTFSHIASRFLKVALAIKFKLARGPTVRWRTKASRIRKERKIAISHSPRPMIPPSCHAHLFDERRLLPAVVSASLSFCRSSE